MKIHADDDVRPLSCIIDTDSQPSNAGDRYLLKLFRDFVFHQISEDGAPVMDWGLVMEAMSKLDAGVLLFAPFGAVVLPVIKIVMLPTNKLSKIKVIMITINHCTIVPL